MGVGRRVEPTFGEMILDVVLVGVNRAFEDNKARASAISVEK